MWPNLDEVSFKGRVLLRKSQDSFFLGIHEEEVEMLKDQDEEFLKYVHVVPI